jgi:hypothetical protein
MATAFITFRFFAVVVGYVFNSLPGDYYTEFDDRLIALIVWKAYQPRKKKASIDEEEAVQNSNAPNEENTGQGERNVVAGNTAANGHEEDRGSSTADAQHPDGPINQRQDSSAHTTGPSNSQETQTKESTAAEKRDEMKIEALQRVILALSDQQLIVGLAILAAGILKSCTVSYWEFEVVVSLAWFSSTTHLSTLVVLFDYLQEHRVLMYWRVGGMLCFLVVLFFSVLSEDALPYNYLNSAPMECVFMSMSSGLREESLYGAPELPLQTAIVLVFLCLAYSNQVVKLLWSDRGISPINACEKVIIRELLFGATYLDPVWGRSKMSRAEWKKNYVRVMTEHSLNTWKVRRKKARIRLATASGWKKYSLLFKATLIGCLELLHEASETYLNSFVWQIVWLIFGLSYGIAQIVQVRWYNLPPLNGSTNHMDFGQIVPLLLLTLPALAAGEAYYGVLILFVQVNKEPERLRSVFRMERSNQEDEGPGK